MPGPPSGRGRAVLPTLMVLGVLGLLFVVFVNVWTERLWFGALDFSSVFTTRLVTQSGLFLGLGIVTALIVIGNAVIAYRVRPEYRPMNVEQQSLERYREAIEPVKVPILLIIGVLLMLMAGGGAASSWRTFLLWFNRTDFGTADPQFGLDASFYIFEYPFWRFLLSTGFAILVLSILLSTIVHYLYGGLRLQSAGQRITPAAGTHLSILVGLLLLLKAAAYWLDRYALVITDNSLFTGASYTDVNAVLPAKTILAGIAVVCAILFFVATFRRTWMLAGISAGLLLLSALLLSTVWPALVQQFQVRPSEADRESEYIARNINATREAFDIDAENVDVSEYAAVTTATSGQLRDDADTVPGIRLLDPTVVPPTFQQLQQVRGFYSFSDPLDVVPYELEGKSRDMVVAVREIDLAGIPDAQQNWINESTVYTHGFGYVAAYGNQRNADGSPVWAEEDIPPTGALSDELGDYEPRIYYGENSPPYSIVGAPEGTAPVEFDIPTDSGSEGQLNTYDGDGGVEVGGFLQKVLYATRFQEGNILLSNRVNSESKILYDRDPRVRVEKVAPWLTVDGDPYPVVADGRVVWVLDGYTTAENFPYSQRIGLETATQDSRTELEGVAAQQEASVNYMRNSVKATVDAYDGTVTLYEWDTEDPLLAAWRSVFPETVQDREDIPDELLEHIRYPEDLFKVQRGLLSRYHVSDPETFYSGQDFWQVPNDPTVAVPVPVPPYYLTLQMPGQEQPSFSLTTTYTPRNRQNLAAFMAVNADASSPDYGTIRALRLPGSTQVDGPSQVANTFETNQAIAQATLPLRQSGAETREGNLMTLPVGDGLLYVQPVYVERRSGDASFPLLRLVFASFGSQVGVGDTLQEALDQVFQGDAGADTGENGATPGGGGGGGDGGGDGDGGDTDASTEEQVAALLARAQTLYEDAQEALQAGEWADYGDAVEELGQVLDRAAQLSGQAAVAPSDEAAPPAETEGEVDDAADPEAQALSQALDVQAARLGR